MRRQSALNSGDEDTTSTKTAGSGGMVRQKEKKSLDLDIRQELFHRRRCSDEAERIRT